MSGAFLRLRQPDDFIAKDDPQTTWRLSTEIEMETRRCCAIPKPCTVLNTYDIAAKKEKSRVHCVHRKPLRSTTKAPITGLLHCQHLQMHKK